MRVDARLAAVVSLTLVAALAACAPNRGVESDGVTGIPEAWLTATAEGWPSSDGYGRNIPVMTRGEKCLLAEEPPEMLGGGAKFTDSGWGRYGDSPDGYQYECGLWKRGSYAGHLLLTRASSADEAAVTVEKFRTQKSTVHQDNSVEEITSGQLDLLVLTRWYPTNPQGEYQALYADEEANALVVLEINSLSEEDFSTLTPQDVADALVEAMAASS